MSEDRLTYRKELTRVRRPRVHITYDVEVSGAEQTVSLPFIVGVLADFCGSNAAQEPLNERKFIEIDVDNFSSVMAMLHPSVTVEFNGMDPFEIEFASITDFTPESLLSRVQVLQDLIDLRSRLLSQPSPETDDLVALLHANGLVELHTDHSPEAAIDAVDRQITERLHGIIRHPGFRSLESAWRSLWYLVVQTETSESLRIEILHITKRELWKDLNKAGSTDKSWIFKRVYEDRYGMDGANPLGVLIGDYQFSQHPADIDLLKGMAGVSATAHAPFVAAVSAQMFGLDRYTDLLQKRDIKKVFHTFEYAAWNSFRDSEDARWVALTLPEMLLRTEAHYRSPGPRPYVFNDDDPSSSGLLWGNAAFALAACMTRAFARENWLSDIQGVGGGRVENLVMAATAMNDGSRKKVCTSLSITDTLESALYDSGFAALKQSFEGDEAMFFAVPSCQRAKIYDSAEATGNARVLTRLPAVMVCARFAQYLKVITRDRIGSFKDRADHERHLNRWLAQYVSHEPAETDEQRARYPLREGEVSVTEMPGSPGIYRAMLYLRPQYGMDGLTVSLRVPVMLSAAL